jgi:hypothetical protein
MPRGRHGCSVRRRASRGNASRFHIVLLQRGMSSSRSAFSFYCAPPVFCRSICASAACHAAACLRTSCLAERRIPMARTCSCFSLFKDLSAGAMLRKASRWRPELPARARVWWLQGTSTETKRFFGNGHMLPSRAWKTGNKCWHVPIASALLVRDVHCLCSSSSSFSTSINPMLQ